MSARFVVIVEWGVCVDQGREQMKTALAALMILMTTIASAETNLPAYSTFWRIVNKDVGTNVVGQVEMIFGNAKNAFTTNTFTSTNALLEFLETLPKKTVIYYHGERGLFIFRAGTNDIDVRVFDRICTNKDLVFYYSIPDW
jgi:hypothetical protein